MTPARIADRIQIVDVLHEYCRCIDEMDLDALVALFVEPCVVEYGPAAGFASAGRTQLRRDLERLWRYARTAHHLSNVQVRFDGDDQASVRSAVLAWHEWPDRRCATLHGRYDDRFLRTAEGWRIARRRLTNMGGDAAFDASIHPHPRRPRPPGWAWP